jgi:CarD family transcriptional regulator
MKPSAATDRGPNAGEPAGAKGEADKLTGKAVPAKHPTARAAASAAPPARKATAPRVATKADPEGALTASATAEPAKADMADTVPSAGARTKAGGASHAPRAVAAAMIKPDSVVNPIEPAVEAEFRGAETIAAESAAIAVAHGTPGETTVVQPEAAFFAAAPDETATRQPTEAPAEPPDEAADPHPEEPVATQADEAIVSQQDDAIATPADGTVAAQSDLAPAIAAPVTAAPAAPAPTPHAASERPAEHERRPMSHADRIPPRLPSKAEIFVEGDHVVYPTHGVGKVEKIATEEIAGHKLELIHITFEENRMTLRVPVAKARSAGLRKLATRKLFDEALGVLKGRARIKRTMWSRRAQEYEAKINSGDPLAIAEVVRDLHRNAGQPDQSFSERQIYEAAMDRLAAELAALDETDKSTAVIKLGNFLKTV